MARTNPHYIPLYRSEDRRDWGPHLALKISDHSLELGYVGRMHYIASTHRPEPHISRWAALGDLAFEAFTLGAESARQSPDRVVRPEHILLGIVGVAPQVMSTIDSTNLLSIDSIRHIQPDGGDDVHELSVGSLKISGSAIRVLWNAVGQAQNHKAFYVDIHHLLASLSRTECPTGELLVSNGLSADKIYDRLKRSKIDELFRLTKTDKKPPYDPYKLTGRIIHSIEANYKLVRFVNIGGMGAVYAALRTPREVDLSGLVLSDLIVHSPLHVHPVCVKFLKPDIIAQHPLYGKAFKQEIEIVKDLIHPHIVRIADTGQTDEGLLYYAMEWVDGKSLEELINESPLSAEECLVILKQVCAALDVAHQRKIIHLDIKPGNIMTSRREDGEITVKIIDFGLAKVASEVGMTTTLTQVGFTLQYCAPEVFIHKASPRSDVFSLGATLYVMLTGVMPFGTSYVFAKQRTAADLPGLPPLAKQRSDLPPAVDDVIARALQRDPHLRQSSAMEFLEEYRVALVS